MAGLALNGTHATLRVKPQGHIVRALEIPDFTALAKDPKAVELIRFWVGGDKCHIALNIGVWQDSGEPGVDELQVWANVLSDITKHVANAMEQRYQIDYETTMTRIQQVYAKCIHDDKNIKGS